MRRTALFAAFAVLLLTLSLSACVVEPYGEHYHDGEHYHGHDDGHRVWRE
jgi:hypothetical protein